MASLPTGADCLEEAFSKSSALAATTEPGLWYPLLDEVSNLRRTTCFGGRSGCSAALKLSLDSSVDRLWMDPEQLLRPSDMCRDFREGAAERFSSTGGLRSVRQWGAFFGAGDSLGAVLAEDTLRASSDSPSVRPVSSLELDSGLLTHAALLGPFESCDGVRRRSRSDLSLAGAEGAGLEELFSSEEWEDRDSMLPMGVLPGLLLKASPMQGLSASARQRVGV